jgi:hypothetical protein
VPTGREHVADVLQPPQLGQSWPAVPGFGLADERDGPMASLKGLLTALLARTALLVACGRGSPAAGGVSGSRAE